MECGGKSEMLGWEDLSVIGAMVTFSCGVGAIYAWIPTSKDHLTAGGTMSTLPMALSLATGFITAIELLGNPSEMFYNGAQFWMTCISFLIVAPVASYFYLPVYMELRLTSTFEYLEMRFNKWTRYFASFLYVVQMVLYTSIAVYAPALALSHVTGLNTYLAVAIVYVVCIFYASQGGMKAVIITDTFQTAILLVSILAVAIIGDYQVGGPRKVFKANYDSGRLELFNFDPSPTVRHSFWSVVIGGCFYWSSMFCANQATIQKYLSVKTLSQARRALWISCVGLILIFTVNFYTGMVMYAYYENCDPLSGGEIRATDELSPFYVIRSQGHLKGVPGLFIAGIFAASLGTVAAAVNSLAAVTVRDMVGGLLQIRLGADREASISKWLSLAFGILSFALVFLVEELGSVLQVALSFNGIIGGVSLGLFSLGMFNPWASSKGAVAGALLGLASASWMGATGMNRHNAAGKPLSTESCPCNVTLPPSRGEIDEAPSYLWYSVIGCLVTFTVGTLHSILSGRTSKSSPTLISPPISNILARLRPKEETDSKMTGINNPGLETDPEMGLKP